MMQFVVSYVILVFEMEFGIKLIIWECCNGLRFMDMGKKIFVYIREVFKGIEKVEQLVVVERGFEQGMIYIGIFLVVFVYFILKLISVFKKWYLKFELVLYEGMVDEVKEWL